MPECQSRARAVGSLGRWGDCVFTVVATTVVHLHRLTRSALPVRCQHSHGPSSAAACRPEGAQQQCSRSGGASPLRRTRRGVRPREGAALGQTAPDGRCRPRHQGGFSAVSGSGGGSSGTSGSGGGSGSSSGGPRTEACPPRVPGSWGWRQRGIVDDQQGRPSQVHLQEVWGQVGVPHRLL